MQLACVVRLFQRTYVHTDKRTNGHTDCHVTPVMYGCHVLHSAGIPTAAKHKLVEPKCTGENDRFPFLSPVLRAFHLIWTKPSHFLLHIENWNCFCRLLVMHINRVWLVRQKIDRVVWWIKNIKKKNQKHWTSANNYCQKQRELRQGCAGHSCRVGVLVCSYRVLRAFSAA